MIFKKEIQETKSSNIFFNKKSLNKTPNNNANFSVSYKNNKNIVIQASWQYHGQFQIKQYILLIHNSWKSNQSMKVVILRYNIFRLEHVMFVEIKRIFK